MNLLTQKVDDKPVGIRIVVIISWFILLFYLYFIVSSPSSFYNNINSIFNIKVILAILFSVFILLSLRKLDRKLYFIALVILVLISILSFYEVISSLITETNNESTNLMGPFISIIVYLGFLSNFLFYPLLFWYLIKRRDSINVKKWENNKSTEKYDKIFLIFMSILIILYILQYVVGALLIGALIGEYFLGSR